MIEPYAQHVPCGDSCDNSGRVNILEHQRHQRSHDVADEIARLASTEPYRRALAKIRDYAADILAEGYPREELYAELDRARGLLEKRGYPDEAEDPILDVMDFLVGYCSPDARL